MKKVSYISNFCQEHKKDIKIFLENVKKYDHIVVFRHIKPDFDALGTQMGLATWLKENFPNKDIKVVGDNHVEFTPRGLFPKMDELKDSYFDDPFLAVIVDVGDDKRIADPRYKKGSFIFKFDHHPYKEEVANHFLVDINRAAASEIISDILINLEPKYKLSKLAARYLYIALIGDSGSFKYNSTTPMTFEVAENLVSTGIDIPNVYEEMFQKDMKDLEVTKFILDNFKISKEGVAYYIFTQKDLDKFGMASEQGKDNVNFFAPYKGINIWCSITEDITEPCYRISIRSRNFSINDVAAQFSGGGHAQAAGAQIKDLTELDKFISALDAVVIANKK